MRMTAAFIACVALTATSAPARAEFDGDAKLRESPCGREAIETVRAWNARRPWFRALATAPGETLMRAPTAAIGKWIEASARPDRTSLRLINLRQILSIEFDSGCRARARIARREFADRFGALPRREGFRVLRDADVERAVKSGERGAFFLWSPHKKISVEGLREFRRAARAVGAVVYAVVDSNASAAAVRRESRALGVDPERVVWFDSFDLQNRGLRLHHPSFIAFSKGDWSSPVRRGFEYREIYEDYLRGHFN